MLYSPIVSPASISTQQARPIARRRPGRSDHEPQTPDHDLTAARLVDEVDRTSLESQGFVAGQAVAGQEHNRQVDTAPAQLGKQVNPRRVWEAPIQEENIEIGSAVETHCQGRGIGET